jgi:hypothetical protein
VRVRAALACLFASSLLAGQARADGGDTVTLPAGGTGGVPALATAVEIDRACDAAEKRAGPQTKGARIFADVAPDEPGAGPMWRSFPSMKALEHATPDGPPQTQASVWPPVGGVVFVSLFFSDPSGDWAQFSDLCYRPDGTLARTVDTLNTFAGGEDDRGVSRVHALLFDGAGQILRRRSKVLDLQTRKPVKAPFTDEKDRIFLRFADLPFSDLLSSSAQ